MKDDHKVKMSQWEDNNPEPDRSDFGKGKRGEKKYWQAVNNYWDSHEDVRDKMWEGYEGTHYSGTRDQAIWRENQKLNLT